MLDERILSLKKEIVGTCEKCSGRGFTLNEMFECSCMIVFKYLRRLLAANISRDYWQLSISELNIREPIKKFLEFYTERFDRAVVNSAGVLFLGHNGTGKTSSMIEIGKHAIVSGYKVIYTTAEKYIQSTFTRSEIFKDVDVVLLDEIGKVPIKENSNFIPLKLEDLFRELTTGKVLIGSTNLTEQEFVEQLGESSFSALKRKLKLIPVPGDDYSNKKQNEWRQLLENDYDYYHKNIIEKARALYDKR